MEGGIGNHAVERTSSSRTLLHSGRAIYSMTEAGTTKRSDSDWRVRSPGGAHTLVPGHLPVNPTQNVDSSDLQTMNGLGSTVTGDEKLFIGIIEGIEGMEKLFFSGLLPAIN